MQDKKARLVLNSLFSLLSWLTPFGLGLLFTPIILAGLGDEAFGVYLVILGFISYSFPFNIGRTVTKYVAEFHASGESSKVNDAISSGFWLSLSIGLLGAIGIALVAPWLVADVLRVSPNYRHAAQSALIFGGFSIPVLLTGQVFQNVLQGIHKFGRVSLLVSLNSLFLYAGNVTLVLSGFGIVAMFGWNLATSFLILIFSFAFVRNLDASYTPSLKVTRTMFAAVASYGFGVFSYQIFGLVLLTFERAWLLREFGAAESAYYLLPMSLGIYIHSLVGSLMLAAFPAVNELLNDRGRLVKLYQKATKVLLTTTALAVATAICSGKVFLIVWVGRDFAVNAYANLVLHSLTFGLIAMMIVIWQINEGNRAARINAIQVFIWGAVAIPLMVVTSFSWSAEGVAASRLFGVIVTIPMLFYCERRFLGRIFLRFWTAIILKVGLAVAILAAIELSILSVFEPSWTGLLVATGIGTVAFVATAFLTGLVTADERELLKRFLNRGSETSKNG